MFNPAKEAEKLLIGTAASYKHLFKYVPPTKEEIEKEEFNKEFEDSMRQFQETQERMKQQQQNHKQMLIDVQVEATRIIEAEKLAKQGNDNHQVNIDAGNGKVNIKSDIPKTRTTNLKRAINQAIEDIGYKPSFNDLWQYFQGDKDKSGFIQDYTDTHLTWIDTKGKLHDTRKDTIKNHLSNIES